MSEISADIVYATVIDSIVPTKTTLARSRLVRMVYATLGVLWLGIAIVGIVMPLIPTTGPVLLAGFFFSRSSERFDLWLVNHRVFGPIIRDRRAGVGFSPRLKTIAVIAIAATFTLSVGWIVDSRPVRIGLVLFALGLIRYILRLPTKRDGGEAVTAV